MKPTKAPRAYDSLRAATRVLFVVVCPESQSSEEGLIWHPDDLRSDYSEAISAFMLRKWLNVPVGPSPLWSKEIRRKTWKKYYREGYRVIRSKFSFENRYP